MYNGTWNLEHETATLKSIDYNVAMTFILNNNEKLWFSTFISQTVKDGLRYNVRW